jgi:hypothetical protein
MLKLVGAKDITPVNFQVDTNDVFYPGQLAQLKVVGDKIICGVSNGTAPCGIIDDLNNSNDSTVKHSGRITVWFSKGSYETDQYDTTQFYKKQMILYCGKDGRLTSKKSSDFQVPVATVDKVPCTCSPTLIFSWI